VIFEFAMNAIGKPRTLIAFVLFLLSFGLNAASLNIPSSHPRLWYGNAVRLQQARDYYAQTPFTPGDDIQFERALRSLLTGNVNDCTLASRYMVSWRASSGIGGFRDDTRQQGEELLAIYDWCHGSFSAAERSAIIARWNGYMDLELSDNLGNEGKEANNYWVGRTRNLLMWGIASFGENPRAQEFINVALDIRMGNWFQTWYDHFGRGGVFPEGGDYGVVSLSYLLIPFVSATDFGYDPYALTPYFNEAIYALIYGTTPGPSTTTGMATFGASFFPWNDDEHFYEGGAINIRSYLGDFARYFGVRDPASGNARHARAWLAATNAGRRWMFDALGGSGNPSDLSSLPLDYYAPGANVFDMRTSHDANATQVHLQLGTPGGIEHRHLDAGSFQIWRKGRWLTRESTGYSDRLVAYGEPTGSSVTIDSSEAPAHNTLLFEGQTTGVWIGSGPQYIPPQGNSDPDQPRRLPAVTRLQHEPQFAYVATNYSEAYRNGRDTRADWPYTDKAWREFLFIRPLQALVILDRMRGSSDSQRPFYLGPNWLWTGPHVPGSQVRRSFIMHFETSPTVNGNRLSATVGNQISELTTLIPATSNYRVINEDVPGDEQSGQYRLELDSVGSTESYFLNVVTGYDNGEARITANLNDNGNSWTVTLNHPVRGNASVTFMKGMNSMGGSVSINGGLAQLLREDVQSIQVTSDGPVWNSDSIFADGFESQSRSVMLSQSNGGEL
jgi:hypothetical protein